MMSEPEFDELRRELIQSYSTPRYWQHAKTGALLKQAARPGMHWHEITADAYIALCTPFEITIKQKDA